MQCLKLVSPWILIRVVIGSPPQCVEHTASTTGLVIVVPNEVVLYVTLVCALLLWHASLSLAVSPAAKLPCPSLNVPRFPIATHPSFSPFAGVAVIASCSVYVWMNLVFSALVTRRDLQRSLALVSNDTSTIGVDTNASGKLIVLPSHAQFHRPEFAEQYDFPAHAEQQYLTDDDEHSVNELPPNELQWAELTISR